jgi:hypothetical protein
VRLSLSGCAPRTAGEDFETSRLPARPRPGENKTERELDHLLIAFEAIRGIEDEFAMPPELRAIGSGFSQGPATFGKSAIKLLRAGRSFREE